MRKSGILLPISSLPSNYGIGAFSKEAYEFVDFLKSAGQKLWQILPLGPTSYGDSPYQSFSTFAGNPYFIDLETLVKEGLLTKQECDERQWGTHPEYVDYEKIYESRFAVLQRAFDRAFGQFGYAKKPEYVNFVKANEFWLEDYALFMAIKDANEGKSFTLWTDELRLRKESAMAECRAKYAREIEFYKFQQYLFQMQWKELKAYANKQGIEIVGDIPIYVSADSADVWANPKLFQLTEDGLPSRVAGCPPDAFSATGQLWGNPLYDWDYHKKTDYKWWMQRIAFCYELYDVLRIDHFRGFDEYWSIPYGDPTAVNGQWVKGPGYDLFATMKKVLGDKAVIAEDLGFMTDTVMELVEKTGFPGMKVLQFAFDSREESDYLPHNYVRNSVVYTGTHDNDTTLSWYSQLPKEDKALADEYLEITDTKDLEWKFIRSALGSVADTAIIPMQDYLALGGEARINTPSTLGINWKWRMKAGVTTEALAARIKKETILFGRAKAEKK
ncbi:MAG: 4-alpha-glucanotransferase [Lachnospiraceae bacterium]|nr:4-alpha-glucanotransferase [Lachnospiraceae bacterium]